MSWREAERQVVLDEGADDAVGGAAQGKRVLGAGGDHAEGEHSGDGVGFVGDGQDGAFERAGNFVFHGGGLVLIVDGLADGDGRAFGKLHALGLVDEVESADDALEFGELLDQFGGEIALGHERGFVDHAGTVRGIDAGDDGADEAAEVLGADGLVVVAAQLLLEGDRLEHGHAVLEGELLVGVPEEARVVEAGAQDALIAVADDGFALGVGNGVEHGEKVRREFAVRVLDGEVLLVVAHDGDQDFLGQGEELGRRSCRG